jgi:hypothetical protein
MVNNETVIIAYTLRTIAVTADQWISSIATTMEDDTIGAVQQAHSRNMKALHTNLATPPPLAPLGLSSAWREPYNELLVTIHETVIKQDLISGEALDERNLETYTIRYDLMNTEEN